MIDLAFTITVCDACGAENPVTLGCTTCGAEQPRPDPHVEARRALLASVADAYPAPSEREVDDASSTPARVLADLRAADTVPVVLELLRSIDTPSPDWVATYAASRSRLDRIVETAAASPLRGDPALAGEWFRIDGFLLRSLLALDGFERAVTANTPDRARDLATGAQHHLDAVAR